MLRPRVIPVLTLQRRSLVKTLRFGMPLYLGDPVNALRIFNTKEVDEVVILDITASEEGRAPDIGFVTELAGECFMPVCFGGGITSVAAVERVLKAGIEKVAINTAFLNDVRLASEASDRFGSQAIVASVDVKRGRLGRPRVARTSGKVATTDMDPVAWVRRLQEAGVGEVLLTAVDRDGTAEGYDLELVRDVSSAVPIPVVACGGAGSVHDLRQALRSGAAAAGAGRMFVTHGKHRASLVSYLGPDVIAALSSGPVG